MTKKLLAVAALTLIAVSACARNGGTNAASSPALVYGAAPTESDVRSLLGSNDWWEATPSFKLRPLGLPAMLDVEKFAVTSRFVHLGTSELFITEYLVFTNTSYATQTMTIAQNNFGGTTTPSAGDGALYTTQRGQGKTSLYSSLAFVRVGQAIITIAWERDQGYADSKTMGRIANALAKKLKDVNSGKVKPSPVPQADTKLLPPAGTEVTLVGATRLPIDAAVASLGFSSPQAVVDTFHQAGVQDFVYGDYALNADLNMEVRGLAFTFQSPDAASSFVQQLAGSGAVDSNGVAEGYSAAGGFYYAFFSGGSHLAMLFCNSLDPATAASRSCEAPMASLIGSWQYSLTQV